MLRFPMLLLLALAPSSASLAVVHVDQNSPGPAHDGAAWDTAFLTIQEGVVAATPHGEVWVADGVYYENVVMGEGVALYGGFLGAEPGGYETSLDQRDYAANVAAIDGHWSGSCVTMAATAVVDGFTITRGSGALREPYTFGHGGGLYCYNLGDDPQRPAVIANNTIADNWGKYFDGQVYWGGCGGAVCCCSSYLTIAGNTLTNNWGGSGGAVYCEDSSPAVTDNAIHGNQADEGGAVYCDYSSPTVTGNTVIGNEADDGGAILCYFLSSPTVASNVIRGNSAEHSGGAVLCERSCSPEVTNNVIADNSAGWSGGALYFDVGCSAILTNNTIARNSSRQYSAAVYCESSATIANNIVTGNSARYGGAMACDGRTALLTHNDVWGNTPEDYRGCEPGEGDISEDPLFVDPDNGDYHLAAASPCIDAGDNAAPHLPCVDFEGDPRVGDGNGDEIAVVDIGADEYWEQYETTRAPGDWFVPGWVWFSLPLAPRVSADGSDVLGFDCTNRLYGWDDAAKNLQLYPDDFTDLMVGPSYLARLNVGESYVPFYEGSQPELPFMWTLPAAGWCWVGVPSTQHIEGAALCVVKGGVERTAAEDRASADAWLNWNWIYWDPVRRAAKIMDPFGGGDDSWLHPWWGYRVWSNTEDVAIIFP
jgi:predicted outer membrane repeat protein